MRTIYLQHSLSIQGRRALRGRKLADALRGESEDFLLCATVYREESMAGLDSAIRPDVISEVQLLSFEPTVLVVEGGLFWGKGGAWRIDRALADDFVKSGGTFIVADVDLNTLSDQRSEYVEVAGFLGASASYNGREPVAGYDERRYWKGTKQIRCVPSEMVISEWLRPVYEDIPEVLCGLPVRLQTSGDILASGNRDSTWSHASGGTPRLDNLPWASVRKLGAGFVVFIAAAVVDDVWLEGCPHNTAWLVNICKFLSDAALTDRQRAQAVVKSQESLFFSHAWADKDIVSPVSALLTREYALPAWIDAQELLPGDSVPQHIKHAIAAATAFVLFWSKSAAESRWVESEIEVALTAPEPTVVIVRLDDTDLPTRLDDLLRVEAAGMDASQIADRLGETIRRRQSRARIEEVRERGANAIRRRADNHVEAPEYPSDASLTRGPGYRRSEPTPSLVITGARVVPPIELTSLESSFRVDILSFVDRRHLLVGSGTVEDADIARVQALGLVETIETVSCQTGMDGHLDDHVASRRHLIFGYEFVQIVDRSRGDVVATIKCEEHANVMSAAWSPDGDLVVVGSTNYYTIADERGRHVRHENVVNFDTNYAPKSVVWQPSTNPMYVTGATVVVTDNKGHPLRTLAGLESAVVAVAVSSHCRYIAAATRAGEVVLWSEWGEQLAVFAGVASDAWHASHCLEFSPDSRYLCQAACTGGDSYFLAELDSGKTARVPAAGVNLLTFHPAEPHLLVTAASRTISFWQLDAGDLGDPQP